MKKLTGKEEYNKDIERHKLFTKEISINLASKEILRVKNLGIELDQETKEEYRIAIKEYENDILINIQKEQTEEDFSFLSTLIHIDKLKHILNYWNKKGGL